MEDLLKKASSFTPGHVERDDFGEQWKIAIDVTSGAEEFVWVPEYLQLIYNPDIINTKHRPYGVPPPFLVSGELVKHKYLPYKKFGQEGGRVVTGKAIVVDFDKSREGVIEEKKQAVLRAKEELLRAQGVVSDEEYENIHFTTMELKQKVECVEKEVTRLTNEYDCAKKKLKSSEALLLTTKEKLRKAQKPAEVVSGSPSLDSLDRIDRAQIHMLQQTLQLNKHDVVRRKQVMLNAYDVLAAAECSLQEARKQHEVAKKKDKKVSGVRNQTVFRNQLEAIQIERHAPQIKKDGERREYLLQKKRSIEKELKKQKEELDQVQSLSEGFNPQRIVGHSDRDCQEDPTCLLLMERKRADDVVIHHLNSQIRCKKRELEQIQKELGTLASSVEISTDDNYRDYVHNDTAIVKYDASLEDKVEKAIVLIESNNNADKQLVQFEGQKVKGKLGMDRIDEIEEVIAGKSSNKSTWTKSKLMEKVKKLGTATVGVLSAAAIAYFTYAGSYDDDTVPIGTSVAGGDEHDAYSGRGGKGGRDRVRRNIQKHLDRTSYKIKYMGPYMKALLRASKKRFHSRHDMHYTIKDMKGMLKQLKKIDKQVHTIQRFAQRKRDEGIIDGSSLRKITKESKQARFIVRGGAKMIDDIVPHFHQMRKSDVREIGRMAEELY